MASVQGLGGKLRRSGTEDLSAAALTVYRAAADAMGLTRLASVTGLDRLGIPVAAAFRPNAPSVCVNHGKGLTPAAAKASALGEALELWHAEAPDLTVTEASAADLRRNHRCAPIYDLPQRAGSTVDEDTVFHWVKGVGLFDGTAVMTPLASICMDLTRPPFPGSDDFAASSSGLGAGLTREDAVLHGLCEVVERDAHALWLLRGNTLADVTPVDPDAAPEPVSHRLIAQITDAEVTVGLADITGDIPLPTVLAVLLERGGRNPNETPFALGTACHPHPETALVKALLEAAQMRLLQITALRDDLTATDYRGHNSDIWRRAATALGAAAGSFRLPAGAPAPETEIALPFALKALAKTVPAEPILVDLTRRDTGIPVVKLLAPGLEDGVDLATHRLGRRGLQAKLESK